MTDIQTEPRAAAPFDPTRTAALQRLADIVPKAGRAYATLRNYDLPQQGHPHVSRLSPYLRHRLITEAEVVEAVLARHTAHAADKFIQEVFWRTYWKGWLERRPSVWSDYLKSRDQAVASLGRNPDLRAAVARAEAGETEIEAFNAWIAELVATGYLHNHARMWVASIWIFTLRLPWEIGADFFMRHLLDGDPASNTLGWRWVAGLQTQGKHYVARSSNIAKYTEGRHNPGPTLATQALPLASTAHPALGDMPVGGTIDPGQRSALLLTEDDLSPGMLRSRMPQSEGCAGLLSTARRSRQPVSSKVQAFAKAAMEDSMARWGDRFGGAGPITDTPDEIADWARALGVTQIVTPHAPTGPAASRLRYLTKTLAQDGITVIRVLRDWDRHAWPHATHGFFRFKAQIPALIEAQSVDNPE